MHHRHTITSCAYPLSNDTSPPQTPSPTPSFTPSLTHSFTHSLARLPLLPLLLPLPAPRAQGALPVGVVCKAPLVVHAAAHGAPVRPFLERKQAIAGIADAAVVRLAAAHGTRARNVLLARLHTRAHGGNKLAAPERREVEHRVESLRIGVEEMPVAPQRGEHALGGQAAAREQERGHAGQNGAQPVELAKVLHVRKEGGVDACNVEHGHLLHGTQHRLGCNRDLVFCKVPRAHDARRDGHLVAPVAFWAVVPARVVAQPRLNKQRLEPNVCAAPGALVLLRAQPPVWTHLRDGPRQVVRACNALRGDACVAPLVDVHAAARALQPPRGHDLRPERPRTHRTLAVAFRPQVKHVPLYLKRGWLELCISKEPVERRCELLVHVGIAAVARDGALTRGEGRHAAVTRVRCRADKGPVVAAPRCWGEVAATVTVPVVPMLVAVRVLGAAGAAAVCRGREAQTAVGTHLPARAER